MSNRAQRRAAERASQQTSTSTISEAQLNANRANAQMSSGPTTTQGKTTSSLNAVKTGLTGRTVLLSSDDAAIYQQHLERIFTQFAPATDQEKSIVQTIADTEWRLLRIAPLESAIYIIGRRELGDLYPNERDPETRQALIQFEIFRTYRKDLNNLALQERRLRNMRKADIAELQALQQTRFEKEAKEQEKEAAKKKATATAAPNPPSPENGFVFSADISAATEPEIGATA